MDESGIAVEDFSFEPKRTHIYTQDADQATKMVKSVNPTATITLKGKVKTSAATGIAAQCPGDTLTVSNFPSVANTMDPSAGVVFIESNKLSQKRLVTTMEIDTTIIHLALAS